MSFAASNAARALLAARREGRPAGPLPAAIAPQTAADGCATQLALAQLLGADPPGGFKIGAIARRMQESLGIDAPLAGFMQMQNIHHSGVILPYANYRGVAVECELAVKLACDLQAAPCSFAQAEAAVGAMFAAIEIVENRYGPPPAGDLQAVGLPTLIADQMYHAACVLGEAGDWRALDLSAIRGVMLRDGAQHDAGHGRDLMGHPINALAWLAGSAEVAAFGGLRAGQIIMLGSVTPPLWLDGPAEITVRFEGFADVAVQLA